MRFMRCTRAISIGAIAIVVGGPMVVFAEGARVTFAFRPASPLTSTSVEIAGAGSRFGLPSLKLTRDGSPVQLSTWSLPLPRFAVRTMSFVPRYGDHQVGVSLQPSVLPDLKLPARRARGIAVETKGPRFSAGLVAGSLQSDRSLNPMKSAVPEVLAMSATVTPRAGIALSPRVVTPLLRRPAGDKVDPGFGVGLRAELARHFTLTGDIDTTRTRARWTPSAIAGLSGHWSRASFDIAAAHVSPGVSFMGPVPFAASRRHLSSIRVQLGEGVTAEGRVSTVNRLRAQRDGTADRAVALHVDRLPWGALQLRLGDALVSSHRTPIMTIMWRERGARGIAMQLAQEPNRRRPFDSATRKFQIEIPNIHRGRDVALSIRSSILLTAVRPGDARTATNLAGRVKAGPIGLSGEIALDALTNGSVARVQRFISRVEIPLPTGASVQVGHEYAAGDRLAAWRRIQIRFTHTLGM
jgi:hypothetical protein